MAGRKSDFTLPTNTLFDTFHKLKHILIFPHLKRVVGKIVDFLKRNIPDFRQLRFVPFLLRGKQLIERVRGQRDYPRSGAVSSR